jgi:hypothetical protein
MTLDEKIEEMINELIIDFNKPSVDDDYPDLIDNWDNRVEAIDYLIELVLKKKDI